MDILIAEDARDQRLLLSRVLQKKGHHVYVAENGKEAFEQLKNNSSIQVVISDWMMPEMDGHELCRKIRAADFSHYIYFILLTGKSDDDAVVQGLDAGADDFLRKPVNFNELQARLTAGFRILELEQRLEEKNNEINNALQTIEKDLQSASKALLSLLPAPCKLQNSSFDWRFKPSKIMGGDMLGYQVLDNEHIAFYQIDVSGHGVPAALFSFSLKHILSDNNPHSSVLLNKEKSSSSYSICSPEEVVKTLNERFQTTPENMMYFTMIYGVLHSPSGKVELVQAGHPPLLHLSSGHVSAVQENGAPVGLVPDFPYQSQSLTLSSGDVLFCYTDGVTENMNPLSEAFGDDRLMQLLEEQSNAPNNGLLDSVMKELVTWREGDTFDDDISCMLMKWRRAKE